jgi:hypothetical protein
MSRGVVQSFTLWTTGITQVRHQKGCETADGDTGAPLQGDAAITGLPLPQEYPMSIKSEALQSKAGQSQRFIDRVEYFECARNAEPAAGEILILCPQTSAPITTGLKIDWVVFKSLPPVAVPMRCPACGLVHRWKPRDAWVHG